MKHVNPFKHTTAEDYEHFLSYMWASGARHNALLCKAYFDGADAPHEEYEAYMTAHPEQAEHEPVAYLVTGPYEKHAFADSDSAEAYCRGLNKGFGDAAYSVSPLYAAPVQQAEQEPVAFADKYGNVMKAKEKLASTNVMTNRYDRPLYEKVGFDADLYSVAGKLALELECLLLDTKDLSVVSKWWDSAHDALEQWRSIKDAAPVHTKDLTDGEIADVFRAIHIKESWSLDFARAVIAADREKNRG